MDTITALRMKLEVLAGGLEVDASARIALSGSADGRIVEHDYVTTGGLTFRAGDVYVNAPVDEWFCDSPAARLVHRDGGFEVDWRERTIRVEVFPLPSYLDASESAPAGVMTHADRIRLSPIDGCVCACRFCDWPRLPYRLLGVETMLEGLGVAIAEQRLPARHVLVSGGTPMASDRDYLDRVYRAVVDASPLPVDVMLMPRPDIGVIDELVDQGVSGFAINLELFDDDWSARLCPQKHGVGAGGYGKTIARAVERTGGSGRVRSLLLVGLEPLDRTLAGVEFLASLGCDPVLSPFRPAPGTELSAQRPPTADLMEEAWTAASEIVERYGVKLGPRCIPCMHNTVTVPDESGAYHYT